MIFPPRRSWSRSRDRTGPVLAAPLHVTLIGISGYSALRVGRPAQRAHAGLPSRRSRMAFNTTPESLGPWRSGSTEIASANRASASGRSRTPAERCRPSRAAGLPATVPGRRQRVILGHELIAVQEGKLEVRVNLGQGVPVLSLRRVVVHVLGKIAKRQGLEAELPQVRPICRPDDVHVARRSATACAARPSPRPVKPRPSVVVARTVTRSMSTASHQRASRHGDAHVGDLRLSPMRTQSALTSSKPAARRPGNSAGAAGSKSVEPLRIGRREVRRCRLFPPRRGCVDESVGDDVAVGVARHPGSPGKSTPARTSGIRPAKRCASTPSPIRSSLIPGPN